MSFCCLPKFIGYSDLATVEYDFIIIIDIHLTKQHKKYQLNHKNKQIIDTAGIVITNINDDSSNDISTHWTYRYSHIGGLVTSPTDKNQIYITIYDYEYWTMSNYKTFGTLILSIVLIYSFLFIGNICDNYFGQTTGALDDLIDMSHNVAGVTFLALGNGANDISAAHAELKNDGNEALFILDDLFGAATFNPIVVSALNAIAGRSNAPKMDKIAFVRGCTFIWIVIGYAFYFANEGSITLFESIVLWVKYSMYVDDVIFGEFYKIWKQKENGGNIINMSINVNADGDDEDLQNVFCTIAGASIVIGFLLHVIIQVMDEFGNMRSSIKTLGNDLIVDSSEYDDIISINISDYGDNSNSLRIGNDCAGTVTVGVGMKMKDLNNILIKYGYFVRGYGSTQSITIGGALGSCNIRSLYDVKPFGYYLVKVWVIDGSCEKRVFSIETSCDIDYLNTFRCNLGARVLDVVYQVTLEMVHIDVTYRGIILETINDYSDTLEVIHEYFFEEYMLSNNRHANEDVHGHDPGEIIDVFTEYVSPLGDIESVLDLIIGRELYVNLYNNDAVWYIYFKELNGDNAFADNFNSTDETELSFKETYSKENVEHKCCIQYPSFTYLCELHNFVINPIACVFPSIMDIVSVGRIMHDNFVRHISYQNCVFLIQKCMIY